MDLPVRSVRRKGPGSPGGFRAEEEKHPGPDPEEDVPPRLLPDLLHAHDIAVEPLRAVDVGHVQDRLEDAGDPGRLDSRRHLSLHLSGQERTRKPRSPRGVSHATSTPVTREAGDPR